MTIDWDGYEPYDPGVLGPLDTLARVEARQAFDRLMSEKAARIAMLRRLLSANRVELSTSDQGIQELNGWFLANVQDDPAHRGRLLPRWYSIVNDVALFLGDVMIERSPNLRWEFFTSGKKDLAYQRHVIMGFGRVANPKYNVDIDHLLATYAHRIVASRGSIARYGTATVRGVEIDVDAAEAAVRERDIEEAAFVHWVHAAKSAA